MSYNINDEYIFPIPYWWVDIDIDTLNYNLDDLSDAVTNKTKLILIVNILGNPNDFSRIEKIINGRDIILVEDNCESLGAKFNNKMTGTFGKLGTFSFFRTTSDIPLRRRLPS